MKTTEFLQSTANLILISDESTADWVHVPRLRRLWYILSAWLFVVIIMLFATMLLREFLGGSETIVLCARILCLCLWVSGTAVFIELTIEYFRFVLTRRAPIRLQNVLNFYLISIMLFGATYWQLWLVAPQMFSYPFPPVEHSHSWIGGIGFFRLKLEFILFSALGTVGGSFQRIQINSVVSAAFSWVQGAYTLSLVALLIASYVNQKIGPLKEVRDEEKIEQGTPPDNK